MTRDDTPLNGSINIGPTIAARLAAVGLETIGQLRAMGPAEAYQRVKANNPEVTLPVCYYLYSLQGALDGVHWDELASSVKEKLLAEAGEPANRASRRTRRTHRTHRTHRKM